jgi:NADPH-dependent curcumin reductase CurA
MPAATTKVWKLQHAPAGEVDDDTFVLDTEEVPELAEGEILVETVYLSNGEGADAQALCALRWSSADRFSDPGIRSHIQKGANASRTYMSPIREGDVMVRRAAGALFASGLLIRFVQRAYGIGRVVESRSSKWTAGALVIAHMGWRQLAVLPGDAAHLHPAP